jgi:hypothetical protein
MAKIAVHSLHTWHPLDSVNDQSINVMYLFVVHGGI